MQGHLLAFEGIDGSGKHTQVTNVQSWLKAVYNGSRRVGWSSEPNDDNPTGKTIREVLQHKESHLARFLKENPIEFQRLYVIDRAQNIFHLVKPMLLAGNIYIMDRYALSTIAYGMLSGEPAETFIDLHTQVLGDSMIWPDINFFLDISPETAMQRIRSRGKGVEFFDKTETMKRVRENYLSLANHPKFKDSFVVVNGERPPEKIFSEIKTILESRLPK